MQYVENIFLPSQLLKKTHKNAKIITVIGISIGVFYHIVLLFKKNNPTLKGKISTPEFTWIRLLSGT